MQYVDILFPLNLKPLTYRCPEELRGKVQPGMIVYAHLKKRLAAGIVFTENLSPPQGRIRDIHAIISVRPVFGKGMLSLIRWMSDYYMANEGLVLKQTVPSELFENVSPRGSGKTEVLKDAAELPPLSGKDLSFIEKSVLSDTYRTYLYIQPTILHEFSLACCLAEKIRNVIIVLPETVRADLLFSVIRARTGDRACVLHSAMAKGRRSEYLSGIMSGKHDIVIGTRMALFCPMPKPSLILVLQENSGSYKLEEGLLYNIRDVAVMKGFLDNVTVVLSSVTPSIDSYFNIISKKYTLATGSERVSIPAVKVINMRFEKQVRPHITKTLYDKLRQNIVRGRRILIVLNRRGYSTLFQCRDCGYAEKCKICGMPLVFHKEENLLRCHSCSTALSLLEHCPKCRGHNLELIGSGTEKLQEELGELLGVGTLRFDSDKARSKTHVEGMMREISSGSEKVIIGTKMLSKKLDITERFSLAAVLNVDSSLGIPDFRASEKAYMELAGIMQLVEPDGEVIIQSRFPELPLFRHIKKNDYLSFAKEELAMRKAMQYPPYTKMAKVMIFGCRSESMLKKILLQLNSRIAILGPSEVRDKKGRKAMSLMMKADDRKALNSAARAIIKAFEKEETCDVRVDVDPL